MLKSLLFKHETSAETWVSLLSSADWYSVAQAKNITPFNSGIYIGLFYRPSSGSTRYVFVKYSSTGDLILQRQVNHNNYDSSTLAVKDFFDTRYFVGNGVSDSGDNTVLLVKFSPDFSVLDSHLILSNIYCHYAAFSYDGYAFLSCGDGNTNPTIIKATIDGSIIWSTQINMSSGGTGTILAIDKDGNSYLAGTDNSACSTYDGAYIAKFDRNGNIIFYSSFRDSYEYTRAENMCITPTGEIYILVVAGGLQDRYPVIVKYSSTGTRLWQKRIHASDKITGSGGIYYKNGSVYLAMPIKLADANPNKVVFVSMDEAGNIQYSRLFGSGNIDSPYRLYVDNYAVYLCGDSYYVNTNNNTYKYSALTASLPFDILQKSGNTPINIGPYKLYNYPTYATDYAFSDCAARTASPVSLTSNPTSTISVVDPALASYKYIPE